MSEVVRTAVRESIRAGRMEGYLDALKIIVELLEAPYGIEAKTALMEAAERISRLKDEKAA